ncbi:hypothetical protein FVE85_6474 [Porphyridium purpureum]|uniref:Uncharacterized protein n=1 Tax=Porphyridium purpureum TaxID=35688 RepID=A0A5J4Z4H2_PORPP|nr:hypothetical protein FVE85_6474 [Porphyridium purpureum]|eukprot:POR0514..scf295_1
METVRKFQVVLGSRAAWRDRPELSRYLAAFCKVLYGMGLVPTLYSHESPAVCQPATEYIFAPNTDHMNRARVHVLENQEFKHVLSYVLHHAHMFNDYAVDLTPDVQRVEASLMASALETELCHRTDEFLAYWSTGIDPDRPAVRECLTFLHEQLRALVEATQAGEEFDGALPRSQRNTNHNASGPDVTDDQ